ncbi:hypothetical protein [Streptomyces sp. NPDC059788]|uniref:hypothetical protein n=1 Tax=Streptomyces sp. NPDC059788 TaxID=3346948 RepID=UPI0036584455
MNGPYAGRTGRAHADDGGRMARALRASGLPALWADRYPALAEPPARARAAAHVVGALKRLPVSYRFGFEVGLRGVGLGLRVAAARRLAPAAGYDRLARLPGFGRLLTVVDALALYGGLDGEPDT